MAILNDSTGTLMSCAHINHDCRIGIIIGKILYANPDNDGSLKTKQRDFMK